MKTMNWDTAHLRTQLVRTLFVAATMGALVLSAIAESTWG
jgi:hypothetical protein